MLKKLSLFGILAASMLLFSACGDSDNTPENVAKAFLEKIANADFSGAKEYATEASGSMLDMMEQASSFAPDETMKSTGNVEIIKTEKDGDVATVYYKTDDEEEKLKVVKEDGEWKVAFSKSEMMENKMGDEADDMDMDMDMKDLGDSLDAALDDLGDEIEELKEDIEEGHDHDDHEGHDH